MHFPVTLPPTWGFPPWITQFSPLQGQYSYAQCHYKRLDFKSSTLLDILSCLCFIHSPPLYWKTKLVYPMYEIHQIYYKSHQKDPRQTAFCYFKRYITTKEDYKTNSFFIIFATRRVFIQFMIITPLLMCVYFILLLTLGKQRKACVRVCVCVCWWWFGFG